MVRNGDIPCQSYRRAEGLAVVTQKRHCYHCSQEGSGWSTSLHSCKVPCTFLLCTEYYTGEMNGMERGNSSQLQKCLCNVLQTCIFIAAKPHLLTFLKHVRLSRCMFLKGSENCRYPGDTGWILLLHTMYSFISF